MKNINLLKNLISVITLVGMGTLSTYVSADQVINDDLIVNRSACVGFDCVNGESFGSDTLRLKENNLRLHFEDTSSSASFPTNDWRIIANDSTNGGGNYLALEDASLSRQIFRIDAGAAANSLRVDSQGDVGIGTGNPIVELHMREGDTPTVRLEQDGSSGWTPQTWDMAGNETNFFIRDVTNGSTIPFKILPGADANSLVIDGEGEIGVGTRSPTSSLHVSKTDGTAKITVEDASPTASDTRVQLELNNDGTAQMALINRDGVETDWRFQNYQGNFRVTKAGTGSAEMTLDGSGNVTFLGTVSANNGSDVFPDYVFEPGYPLMSLDKLQKFINKNKHLPNIPSKDDVAKNGNTINMTELQYKMLEKIEELTLYTLSQNENIKQQAKTIQKVKTENSQLKAIVAKNSLLQDRLASLEKLVTNLASSGTTIVDEGKKVAIFK